MPSTQKNGRYSFLERSKERDSYFSKHIRYSFKSSVIWRSSRMEVEMEPSDRALTFYVLGPACNPWHHKSKPINQNTEEDGGEVKVQILSTAIGVPKPLQIEWLRTEPAANSTPLSKKGKAEGGSICTGVCEERRRLGCCHMGKD